MPSHMKQSHRHTELYPLLCMRAFLCLLSSFVSFPSRLSSLRSDDRVLTLCLYLLCLSVYLTCAPPDCYNESESDSFFHWMEHKRVCTVRKKKKNQTKNVDRGRMNRNPDHTDRSDLVFSFIFLYSGTALTTENGRLQTGFPRGTEPRVH